MSLRALHSDVDACVEQSEQICQKGAGILTPQEYDAIRRHRDQLKDYYRVTCNVNDRMINRYDSLLLLRVCFVTIALIF